MTKQVFINLPVNNLDKSMGFYAELGFAVYPEFTGENQKCMVWSDHIYIMLQSKNMFKVSIKKQIPDLKIFQCASYTFPVESFDRVNEIVDKALKAGGSEPIPMICEDFMNVRTIEDLDGHTLAFMHLDMEKFRKA